MLKNRSTVAGCAIIGLSIVLHRAAAQTPAPSQTQIRRQRLGGASQQPQQQSPSLADILDKVDWDPATRGTLLIVAPEKTHAVVAKQPRTAEEYRIAQEPPEAEANGSYRLSRLGDYYNRRLTNLSSVSVFVPATMAVLNTTHLPKPDAYAGMSNAEKARLLQSTFTPDQWRRIATPEGIGVGDLANRQRDIFLSMLPDPFVVIPPSVPAVDDTGVTRLPLAPPVTLTADQRASVHLSLARKLDWSFKTGTNGRMSIGFGDPNATQKLRLRSEPMRFEATSDVFGVRLVDEVPSHPKPSQLPSDWEALEKRVDIAQAATVGDLIKAVSKQTGASLYCDPRYEDLKLYTRGSSVQAGDVCKALALAVTGTWRRLGEAFVLTDDLVGLGVRHALIDNWIRQNALLAQVRTQQVDDALAKSHPEDYMGWSANDPLKPDEALSGKIDAFQKELATDRSVSLFVPTTELPDAAQDKIRQQVAQEEASRQRMKEAFPNMREQEPIQPGGVYIELAVQPTYEIPGLGNLAANLGSFQMPRSVIGVAGSRFANRSSKSGAPSVPTALPIAFPTTLPDRAILIAVSAGTDVAKVAQEAHFRGFKQLWVAAKPGETGALKAAVQAGSANGLVVQAVMPLARPAPASKAELADRNILGETLTEYAKRWRSQIDDLRLPAESAPSNTNWQFSGEVPTNAWRNSFAVQLMLRGGDFLRCDDPTAIDEKCTEVGAICAVPGLGGIVFTDVAAPGYNAPVAPGGYMVSSSNSSSDPLLTMGYTDSTRLACLLKNGFDPIDLSPLAGGDRINLPYYVPHAGQPPQMTLPFFPDFGTSTQNGTYNGQSQLSQGAKNSWGLWVGFRQDLDAKFVATVADAAHARSPKLKVMALRSINPLDDTMAYFGSLDGPPASAETPAVAGAVSPKPGQVTRSPDILRDAARAGSRVSYMSLKYDETPGIDEAKQRFVGYLPYVMQNSPEWDGAVFDLRDASPARVLELLTAFPAAAIPAGAASAAH